MINVIQWKAWYLKFYYLHKVSCYGNRKIPKICVSLKVRSSYCKICWLATYVGIRRLPPSTTQFKSREFVLPLDGRRCNSFLQSWMTRVQIPFTRVQHSPEASYGLCSDPPMLLLFAFIRLIWTQVKHRALLGRGEGRGVRFRKRPPNEPYSLHVAQR